MSNFCTQLLFFLDLSKQSKLDKKHNNSLAFVYKSGIYLTIFISQQNLARNLRTTVCVRFVYTVCEPGLVGMDARFC